MRIISGSFKGFSLHITKEKTTRPLKDMTRESIFNLLTHTNKFSFEIKKSTILDLYAGTGSFGLECLSRGAKKVHFFENEKNAFKTLNRNIEKLNLKKYAKTFFNDVFDLNKKKFMEISNFDLIFCDPPYKYTNIDKLIKLIFNEKLLKKNGILIFHRNKNTKEKFPDFFKILDERIYGISKIKFGRFLF